MTTPTPPDLKNPDVLEQIFHTALGKGDIRGVEAALTVMATVDPQRAQRLFDDTKAALALAQGRPTEWRLTEA
jgi:hypothetical protein